ncbi:MULTISPECIES: sensor histidine kinase [Butyricimonas]|uniref:sensor histidine kinase n=1 Tax=Butyricimonas TaxID=574697 RepID=UPI0007FB43B4|nr:MULTISPECIES: HAMP domain-containing sensor histidine kinase [Butyricimonas]
MENKSKSILYIVYTIIGLLLYNQTIHLHQLYQHQKAQYQHTLNNNITNTIHVFHLQSANENNTYSFNADIHELKFSIDSNYSTYTLPPKEDTYALAETACYDIRDTKRWTLKNFYNYLKTKNDSTQIRIASLQFTLTDSAGNIKESYPNIVQSLPAHPEYRDTLGYLTRDILYATYNYPLTHLSSATFLQIATTLFITLLLAFCVIRLYMNYHDEKRQRENQKEYIDSIVHDLKHPVENQKYLCYLLPHLSKEEQIEQAEKNRQELNNMLHSINRMLLRSTDAHGIVLTPKTFNLQEMLETVTAPDRWNTPPDKSFHIRLHFNTPDPMISGDPDFLQAVFQNLIDNSLKYSGEEAEIDITCTAPNDKHVGITIKDNGQGIPPRALRHVFERYHRAQHQGDKKTKGHGLGLYQSRQIIIAHGGKINVDSTPGNGTTFTITLPRTTKRQKY